MAGRRNVAMLAPSQSKVSSAKREAKKLQETGIIVGLFAVFFILHGSVMVTLNMVLERNTHSLAEHILVFPDIIGFVSLAVGLLLALVTFGCFIKGQMLLKRKMRPRKEDKQTFCNEDELRESFRQLRNSGTRQPAVQMISVGVP